MTARAWVDLRSESGDAFVRVDQVILLEAAGNVPRTQYGPPMPCTAVTLEGGQVIVSLLGGPREVLAALHGAEQPGAVGLAEPRDFDGGRP